MLLNKYWLETRNRFFIGVLFISAITLFFVLGQPWILKQWELDEIRDPGIYTPPWIYEAKRDYVFFIWRFLYNYLLQLTWVLFAVMLALGGLTHESEKGSALFTLSLPVTRKSLFFQRAAVGFLEAAFLAFIPVFIIPIFSTMISLHYDVGIALNHSFLFITSGIFFYGLALFINAVVRAESVSFFLVIAMVIIFYFLFQPYSEGMEKPYFLQLINLPGLMAGTPGGHLNDSSWPGILSTLALSAALIFASYFITSKRDF